MITIRTIFYIILLRNSVTSFFSWFVNFIKARRKFSFEGIILVSIVIYKDFSIYKDIKITSNGLPIDNHDYMIEKFKKIFISDFLKINKDKKSSDVIIGELIKKCVLIVLKDILNKKPEVNSHIMRL